MIAAVFALLLMQQQPVPDPYADSALVNAAPAVEETVSAPAVSLLPDWARSDPFAFERARCSALVRGDTPLNECQAQVRRLLADGLGDDLPSTMREAGSFEDCQRLRTEGGGSPYAVQCAPRSPTLAASSLPVERDCRSRPDRSGGFIQECRPTGSISDDKGLKLRLFGGED